MDVVSILSKFFRCCYSPSPRIHQALTLHRADSDGVRFRVGGGAHEPGENRVSVPATDLVPVQQAANCQMLTHGPVRCRGRDRKLGR